MTTTNHFVVEWVIGILGMSFIVVVSFLIGMIAFEMRAEIKHMLRGTDADED